VINLAVKAVKGAAGFLMGKAQSAKAAILDWWNKKSVFSDKRGKSHKLFFTGEGDAARTKVASREMFTDEFVARIRQVFADDPMAQSVGLTYLNQCIRLAKDVDSLKAQLEREKRDKSPSAQFTDKKLQSTLDSLAATMGFLIDLLPESKAENLPVKPGDFVTIPYSQAERKAEILIASKERVVYVIESAKSAKLRMPTAQFEESWSAGVIRPYVEKGSRQEYLGDTPGKASATGKAVIARYKTIVQNGIVHVEWTKGELWPLDDCDMSHDPVDAVTYWNNVRKATFPKSPAVREWMLDPRNYILEPAKRNRSRGARAGERYLPP
jgi:hypothetical protein